MSGASETCPKCGGEGWLWGYELDDYEHPHPGQSDDTRYSCDGVVCKIAAAHAAGVEAVIAIIMEEDNPNEMLEKARALITQPPKTYDQAVRAGLEQAAVIADGYHQRALEWAKKIRGLEQHIDKTDSSRIADDIRALIPKPKT